MIRVVSKVKKKKKNYKSSVFIKRAHKGPLIDTIVKVDVRCKKDSFWERPHVLRGLD